jgi:hypothetical protein
MSVDQAIKSLKTSGFAVLRRAIDLDSTQRLLKLLEHHVHIARPPNGIEPYINQGHKLLYNLQNEDVSFLRAMTDHSELRAVLMALLNDEWYKQIPQDKPNFILRGLSARSSGPESMPFHLDSFIPSKGSYAWMVQAAIILEPQTVENGCTLVIPKSHLSDRYADQDSKDKAIPIESEPGDIVIWDSRLWHSAGANHTEKSRWAILATFSRWWVKQQFDIPRALPQKIYEQLTAEERSVLGFCSMPARDQFDRVDMKTGYEGLKPHVKDYYS